MTSIIRFIALIICIMSSVPANSAWRAPVMSGEMICAEEQTQPATATDDKTKDKQESGTEDEEEPECE